MATRDFSHYFLYRWRYVIGYILVGLLLAGLLVFAGLYVPGGLSDLGETAVVRSASITWSDPSSFALLNLPFHLVQAGVFELFGVSTFTAKIPALLFGFASAIGLIVLLRRWFPPSISILASLIAIATGQFLFVAQSGAGGIMYIFWPILLLLLGTQVTRVKKARLLWKVLFAIAAALSLYTPLSIYILIAIGITVILHPHLRHVIRKLSKPQLALALGLALVFVAPLAYATWQDPNLAWRLLGFPESWPIDIMANIQYLLTNYFFFWDPSFTRTMTPVFGLGTTLLIGLGLYRLIKTYETTRSYLIISWIVCLIPLQILNPQYITVVFLPGVLLLAAGLTSLISYWYRLFPLNPYARIAGLIPIVVLVATLITAGIDRYAYGYHYSPEATAYYSFDLKLLPEDTKTLLVSPSEKPFYDAIAEYRTDLEVITKPTGQEALTATREGRQAIQGGYTTERIITSSKANDADRFYLYEKSSQ